MTGLVFPTLADEQAVMVDALDPLFAENAEYRRWATRRNPALFAWTYLFHQLASPETRGVHSFAAHHLDMARTAVEWADGGPVRDAWALARGGAKSTWSRFLAVWALAHGHRTFALLIGDNERETSTRLAAIRHLLSDDESDYAQLLRADFPELCPARGRGVHNNASQYQARGGQAVAARGISAGALGINIASARPNLIIGDDLEDITGWTEAGSRRRLETWLTKVLPMNERAAVMMLGTTVARGSIMDQVVRHATGEQHAPWVEDSRTAVHYYPAITVDAAGDEASYWPERHTLEWLQSIRGTRDFLLNYQLQPPMPGGEHWNRTLYRYPSEPLQLENRTVYVDPSVKGDTDRDRHDYCAIVIAGNPVGRPDLVVIEYARAWKMSPRRLRAKLVDILTANRDIREVYVEQNQGVTLWADALEGLAPGVHVVLHSAWESKADRIVRSLGEYEQARVIHAVRLPELEDQQERWPAVEHDDLVDDAATATFHRLGGRLAIAA